MKLFHQNIALALVVGLATALSPQNILKVNELRQVFKYEALIAEFREVEHQLGEKSELVKESWKEIFSDSRFSSYEQLKETLGGKFSKLQPETQANSPKFSAFSHESSAEFGSSRDGFEVVSHESHPDHELGIKKLDPSALGLDSVDQYVGYVDVRDVNDHFFYWFFESRNDPKNDPILLWLNGGPGCSSTGGLLFELGPSWINATLQPEYNPYAWNNNASVIYLDQPVGVGYSYSDKDNGIDTSDKAAKDVYVFLELFFRKFPQYSQNRFSVAGESYGGHYIPAIGAELISHPERSFNLVSLLIGNGVVDGLLQQPYQIDMLCGKGGIEPLLTEANCTNAYSDLERCNYFSPWCELGQKTIFCLPAQYFCSKLEYDLSGLEEKKLNPYDVRKKCVDEENLCYTEMGYLTAYMNLPEVKQIIGVSPSRNFSMCSEDVGRKFGEAEDFKVKYQDALAKVLDFGVSVLHYDGDKDLVCDWLGFNAVSNTVEYQHQSEFNASQFKPWETSNGKIAGEIRGAKGFTFLRVYDAGHMVPHDQPYVALDMVNRWLSGDSSLLIN